MHGHQPDRPVLAVRPQLGQQPHEASRLRPRVRRPHHWRQRRQNLRSHGPVRQRPGEPQGWDPTPRGYPDRATMDHIRPRHGHTAIRGAHHDQRQDHRCPWGPGPYSEWGRDYDAVCP